MIYNCHIHTFKEEDIPRRYLPLGLVRILASTPGFKTIGFLLNWINPFTENDQFSSYQRFIKIGKLKSQQDIFEECRKFYPRQSKFIVLSMDMKYMRAGKVPRNYEDQLMELAELKARYPEYVLPFVHADPRRPGIFDLVKKCIEDLNFTGIKLYPSLACFPYDPVLMPILEYAQENKLPVMAHCSPNNPTFYHGCPRKIRRLFEGSKIPIIDGNSRNRRKLCANFASPENYRFLLEQFPDLKICLAHWGSDYSWKKFLERPGETNDWFLIIKDLMEHYNNLYTDISFTVHNRDNFPLLKVMLTDQAIRQRILFGSDFYMVETKATERRFSIDLRGYLGEEDFKTIAVDNPVRYLS